MPSSAPASSCAANAAYSSAWATTSRGVRVPLQLDHDHVALAVHAKQVDRLAEVGRNLAPDDQKRTVFENPARGGFQPLLKVGLGMIGLERQLLVNPPSGSTRKTLIGWLASYPRTAAGR